MDITADALIVGAGPAGSATGALLAEAGLRVVIVDRAAFPRDKPCAEYLSPGAVPILDRLGALRTLRDAGASPLSGTMVVAAYGSRLTGLFANTSTARRRLSGLAVTRRILDAALVDTARSRGATVMERTRVVELVRQRGAIAGAVVATAGGRTFTVTAPVTVGADGLHSVVARWFGPTSRGPLRRWAFVGHFAGVTGLSDRAELHVGTEGYAGLNPIGPDIANVSLVVPRHVAQRARGCDVADFFHRTLERFDGVGDRVPASGSLGPIRSVGPFGIRSRRPVVDGGLLVGDAVEFFDPFTGEGVHAALRGAQLASAAILGARRGPAPLSAKSLRSYLRARRRTFWGKWVVERMIGYGMLMPGLFDRAVDRVGSKDPMAHTLIGVTGHVVSPTAVLNPVYLTRMVL